MALDLELHEYKSLKKSLYYINELFIHTESPKSTHLACIKKWGDQLMLSQEELDQKSKDIGKEDIDRLDKTRAVSLVFDLVYLIYLDGIVEDIELEVSMELANKLNLKPLIVGDLLKAIATAKDDGIKQSEVKDEIRDLVEKGYQEA